MLLYTDGLPESRNAYDSEYGIPRLIEWAGNHRSLSPEKLLAALEKELRAFQSGAPRTDDISIMAIQRTE